jgi:glycosyltransferase involved in cell wall biosynthesis
MFGLRGLHPDREITGFETAFSEIAPRLVARGHRVTVYGRAAAHSPANRPPSADGVELRYIPSPGGKNFSALSSTLGAVLHGLTRYRSPFDVWFFVNVGMGNHCALARLSGRPVVLNVDGLDWRRGKWGPVARAYFRMAARTAVRSCTALVTDCDAMREHYLSEFGRDSTVIAYGADVVSSNGAEPRRLAVYGVRPHEYFLIVSRLIPENSLDVMLDAFRRTRTSRQLLVVGSANYRAAFHERLRAVAAADPRIRLVGAVYDQAALNELWSNCYAYLHGHSVGGTNPALLRAMGHGCCVLALDTVFNRETLADAGLFFPRDASALAALIDRVDGSPLLTHLYRARGPRRILGRYTWERITDQYEQLFRSVASAGPRPVAYPSPDPRSDVALRRERATPRATRPSVHADRDLEAPRR